MSRLITHALLPCAVVAMLAIAGILLVALATSGTAVARPLDAGGELSTVASLVEPPTP